MVRNGDWLPVGMDAWFLGWETATVIWLRMMKLSLWDTAAAIEAERMIAEKFEAAIGLQALALAGGLGASPHIAARRSLRHYGRAVRANRRRLSAPRSR